MTAPPGQAIIERIAAPLATRFHDLILADTILQLVIDSYERLRASSGVSTHLAVMVEPFTEERLAALAQSEGRLDRPVSEVLFVCDANAGRSQMAAGLALTRERGRVHARSPGTAPAAELELAIVEVMAEIGGDPSAEFPKPLTNELVGAADLLVTLGCGGACLVLQHTRYLDWSVPDPTHQPLPEVRRIRDELDLLVTDLPGTLDQRGT